MDAISCRGGMLHLRVKGKEIPVKKAKIPCDFLQTLLTIPQKYLEWTKEAFTKNMNPYIANMRIYFKLYHLIVPRHRNLSSQEKAMIVKFRSEKDPMSIGDIAKVFDRSSSTIHAFLKSEEATKFYEKTSTGEMKQLYAK